MDSWGILKDQVRRLAPAQDLYTQGRTGSRCCRLFRRKTMVLPVKISQASPAKDADSEVIGNGGHVLLR